MWRDPQPTKPPPQIVNRYVINVVTNTSGAVLFLKRAPDKALGGGQWGFPAGHHEPGERADEAAARELTEECGPGFITEFVRRLGPLWFTVDEGADIERTPAIEVVLYQRRYLSGALVLNREHTEYRWLPVREGLALPLFPGSDVDLEFLGLA